MKFHAPGVEPPLMKLYKETGRMPEPIDMRWSWVQNRFQVSYDGYNWYDRVAARSAADRVRLRMNLDQVVSFFRAR